MKRVALSSSLEASTKNAVGRAAMIEAGKEREKWLKKKRYALLAGVVGTATGKAIFAGAVPRKGVKASTLGPATAPWPMIDNLMPNVVGCSKLLGGLVPSESKEKLLK